MKITQNINLDFARSTMPVEVFAKQHDKDTRELVITPFNSGAPYTLESGITARFHMTKADGKTVINNASISNGTIVVMLTAQALSAAGTAVAEVGLYKNDTLLTSQIFYINVQKGAYDEDYVESSDEYGALADALAQYGALADALAQKANISDLPAVPTNVSAFTNDVGYITQHQDISGKVDKTQTIAGLTLQKNITKDQLQTALDFDTKMSLPASTYSVPASGNHPNTSGSDFARLEVGQIFPCLIDNVVTYWIKTDSSTATSLLSTDQAQAMIDTAIGGIENGSY